MSSTRSNRERTSRIAAPSFGSWPRPQRVGGGEHGVRVQGDAEHRAAQALGHRDQRRDRAGTGHLVAGHDREPVRVRPADQAGRRGQVGGDGPGVDGRRGRWRLGPFLFEQVHGQRHEHRPGRVGRVVEGPPHHGAEVTKLVHLAAHFDDDFGPARQVPREERFGQEVAAMLLPGGDHHRRAGRRHVGQDPHRVAEAGGGVQVDERGPSGGLGVPVGHPDDRPLVEAQHVLEPLRLGEGVHQGQLGGARVAEDVPDALRGQHLEQDVAPRPGGHRRWASIGPLRRRPER